MTKDYDLNLKLHLDESVNILGIPEDTPEREQSNALMEKIDRIKKTILNSESPGLRASILDELQSGNLTSDDCLFLLYSGFLHLQVLIGIVKVEKEMEDKGKQV